MLSSSDIAFCHIPSQASMTRSMVSSVAFGLIATAWNTTGTIALTCMSFERSEMYLAASNTAARRWGSISAASAAPINTPSAAMPAEAATRSERNNEVTRPTTSTVAAPPNTTTSSASTMLAAASSSKASNASPLASTKAEESSGRPTAQSANVMSASTMLLCTSPKSLGHSWTKRRKSSTSPNRSASAAGSSALARPETSPAACAKSFASLSAPGRGCKTLRRKAATDAPRLGFPNTGPSCATSRALEAPPCTVALLSVGTGRRAASECERRPKAATRRAMRLAKQCLPLATQADDAAMVGSR
mmetsp:Transcript_123606/g.357498  ORF Transcript_123606/g.357498 Transcript_123606/m.357498 type:complete len:304 (-) Transcript_123606:45-956(-)